MTSISLPERYLRNLANTSVSFSLRCCWTSVETCLKRWSLKVSEFFHVGSLIKPEYQAQQNTRFWFENSSMMIPQNEKGPLDLIGPSYGRPYYPDLQYYWRGSCGMMCNTLVKLWFIHASAIWVLFLQFSIYEQWKCRTELQTLPEQCQFFSAYICHCEQEARVVALYALGNTDSKQNCTSVFPTPFKRYCKLAFALLKILLQRNGTTSSLPAATQICSKSEGGVFICLCAPWPASVIQLASGRCSSVFQWLIQCDDAYLNQSPSCFVAMKLSPSKVQTEKVKPTSLTTTRIYL